jgi:hypothetical protein
MSLSQKRGPQVFYHANGKRCESFSHEASANVPLKVTQASSRTIRFVNDDTQVTVRQSNALDTFRPFREIEEPCRRL